MSAEAYAVGGQMVSPPGRTYVIRDLTVCDNSKESAGQWAWATLYNRMANCSVEKSTPIEELVNEASHVSF
jgi:hypothetical protein